MHITVYLVFYSMSLFSQTITPQVINSAGKFWQLTNGMTLTDNIGEPFVKTIGLNNSPSISQGFLQNAAVINIFSVTVINNNISCKGKNDGNISTAITTNIKTHTVNYTWVPQSVCSETNCSSAFNLIAGTYSLSVKITYLLNNIPADTTFNFTITIEDNNNPCNVDIFSGITPNGDNTNDVFTIRNISEYPNNNLQIYNRWGQLIYTKKGYDNITDAWPRTSDLGKLVSSTYFYVLDLGDGNSSLIKGWVELLKD